MAQLRETYGNELGEAAKRIRLEPQPEPSAAHEYIFADKNYVAGES